jgi:hypothetical protein
VANEATNGFIGLAVVDGKHVIADQGDEFCRLVIREAEAARELLGDLGAGHFMVVEGDRLTVVIFMTAVGAGESWLGVEFCGRGYGRVSVKPE